MIVYRVEHKTKKRLENYAGPYGISGAFSSSDWTDRSHSSSNNHPSPHFDELLSLTNWEIREDMVFGFESIEALQQWFSIGERESLFQLGFVIVSYEVEPEEVLLGSHQLMFLPSKTRTILA